MCVFACVYCEGANFAILQFFCFVDYQSRWAPITNTEGRRFTEFSFNPPNNTTPCARRGKRSAGRTLPGWWWSTARTCCLTQSLWTVGSATWTCSLERGSCWGSVSTASAGKVWEMVKRWCHVQRGRKRESRCVARQGLNCFFKSFFSLIEYPECFSWARPVSIGMFVCVPAQRVLTFSHHAEWGAGGVLSLQRWHIFLRLLPAGEGDQSCESHQRTQYLLWYTGHRHNTFLTAILAGRISTLKHQNM